MDPLQTTEMRISKKMLKSFKDKFPFVNFSQDDIEHDNSYSFRVMMNTALLLVPVVVLILIVYFIQRKRRQDAHQDQPVDQGPNRLDHLLGA